MPPRSRRPPWWPDPKRDLERVALERVVALLRAEGRDVDDLWSPEREPDSVRQGGRTSRPDLALRIDGGQAAIDVTTAWTTERGLAAKLANDVRKSLAAKLQAAALPLSVLVVIVYTPAMLAIRMRGDREADVDTLEPAILDIVGRGPADNQHLAADGLPPWSTGVGVASSDYRAGSVNVVVRPVRDPAHVGEVLDHIAARKGPQLAPWGRGIVALVHTPLDAVDVAALLGARRDWPWWRLYWIGPADAQLLWDRDAHGADPALAEEG